MIFVFSTDAFSGDGTGRLLGPILEFLLPWADADTIHTVHAATRKLGHITEYAVLAVLVFRAMNHPYRPTLQVVLTTVLLCAAYAATDEFHQTFVPSRTAALTDVCIDTGGALVGASVAGWWRKRSLSWGRRSPA